MINAQCRIVGQYLVDTFTGAALLVQLHSGAWFIQKIDERDNGSFASLRWKKISEDEAIAYILESQDNISKTPKSLR